MHGRGARPVELDTVEQEHSAIEQGFRQALIGAFIRLYEDTGDHSKWGDAAAVRFRSNVATARAARSLALQVIEDLKP